MQFYSDLYLITAYKQIQINTTVISIAPPPYSLIDGALQK